MAIAAPASSIIPISTSSSLKKPLPLTRTIGVSPADPVSKNSQNLALRNKKRIPERDCSAHTSSVFAETATSFSGQGNRSWLLPPSFIIRSILRSLFFRASPKDTPALRAGNVQPYQYILPPTWKQMRVANILSGNYCQPKCAEPWVEVKFEDERQGKVQVVASPLIRLTNKPNATIEDIGSPEKLIASLGPFATGNTYDPDELLETSVELLLFVWLMNY